MILRAVLAASIALSFAACSGGSGGSDPVDAALLPIDAAIDASPPIDAFVIPTLRNPVELPDAQLAQQAATLLGTGATMNCNQCHALTRERLRGWAAQSAHAVTTCFSNVAPTTAAEASAIIDCLRAQPGLATSGWPPDHLGIYATAARLDWFRYVWNLAFGAEGATQLSLFAGEAAMPRGDNPPFTQGQFDIVAEWFARDLPLLDDVIGADPPPTTCTTNVTAEVATHVETMATQGWRAINDENGILMFGCAGAATTRGCLASYPKADDTAYGTGWAATAPGQIIRVLRENRYSSAYWTRSSADGRYVSHGGASVQSQTYRATVIDLQQDREIPAAASYDPGFFPDNSGFVLQGGSAKFCEQSLLDDSPAMISFNEPQCRTTSAVGLYQHIGAVHNGDYWTVDGQFTNDNGGHQVTSSDPSSSFQSNASIDLTPMIHTGTQFVPRASVRVTLPREGDVVMSPSARLLVSRVSAGNGQSLYLMRKVVATPSGSTYTVQTPEVARYCVRGAKPAISYDERWMVYQHYVEANDWQSLGYTSAADPAFVTLRQSGASNVFLLELTTGLVRRLTTMHPGQYALYPHFRSDGWIYFLVRDGNTSREYVTASDAALMYEAQ